MGGGGGGGGGEGEGRGKGDSNCLFFKAQESIQTIADLSTINYTDHCQLDIGEL